MLLTLMEAIGLHSKLVDKMFKLESDLCALECTGQRGLPVYMFSTVDAVLSSMVQIDKRIEELEQRIAAYNENNPQATEEILAICAKHNIKPPR